MFDFFVKGGPIMWPLLIASLVALTVVIERFIFLVREQKSRRPKVVGKIFTAVESGKIDEAIQVGEGSKDFLAVILVYGLYHCKQSFSNALLHASSKELKRLSRGLPILDTIITLAPLLGLLGTVTGMIHSFGLLGGKELEAPAAITGGIAQALIATACGLGIAIIALIPFNYLNTRLEEARRSIEEATTHLEILLMKQGSAL